MRYSNIAVFASGKGSNFTVIASAMKRGAIKAKLGLLICDNPEAPVILKASRLRIKTVIIARSDYLSRESFEEQIILVLREQGIDLIVLAGFMRILSPAFVKRYSGRIINIHPALLPSFKGAHAIRDAFEYGVKVTGVTAHFVDEMTDHGPIILQEAVPVKEKDTLESLEKRIHAAEQESFV
jgi:phosphoribosylglycinamide formyltransferase-1